MLAIFMPGTAQARVLMCVYPLTVKWIVLPLAYVTSQCAVFYRRGRREPGLEMNTLVVQIAWASFVASEGPWLGEPSLPCTGDRSDLVKGCDSVLGNARSWV